MVAAILLDREATDAAIGVEPSHGGLKEPILQVLGLMRSMEYQTHIPSTLDGAPMRNDFNVRLWKIDEKIGQGPYEFTSVFSFWLPDYVPNVGPALTAGLVSETPAAVYLTILICLICFFYSQR